MPKRLFQNDIEKLVVRAVLRFSLTDLLGTEAQIIQRYIDDEKISSIHAKILRNYLYATDKNSPFFEASDFISDYESLDQKVKDQCDNIAAEISQLKRYLLSNRKPLYNTLLTLQDLNKKINSVNITPLELCSYLNIVYSCYPELLSIKSGEENNHINNADIVQEGENNDNNKDWLPPPRFPSLKELILFQLLKKAPVADENCNNVAESSDYPLLDNLYRNFEHKKFNRHWSQLPRDVQDLFYNTVVSSKTNADLASHVQSLQIRDGNLKSRTKRQSFLLRILRNKSFAKIHGDDIEDVFRTLVIVGNHEMLERFFQGNPSISDTDKIAWNGFDTKILEVTLLYTATLFLNMPAMQFLLGKGAKDDVLSRTEFGYPLHVACSEGFLNAVELLLKQGNTHRLLSSKGLSPITLASEKNSTEIVRLLITNDAVIENTASHKTTAVQWALIHENFELLSILLPYLHRKRCATLINVDSNKYVSPLRLAYQKNLKEFARLLIKYGAEMPNDSSSYSSWLKNILFEMKSVAKDSSSIFIFSDNNKIFRKLSCQKFCFYTTLFFLVSIFIAPVAFGVAAKLFFGGMTDTILLICSGLAVGMLATTLISFIVWVCTFKTLSLAVDPVIFLEKDVEEGIVQNLNEQVLEEKPTAEEIVMVDLGSGPKKDNGSVITRFFSESRYDSGLPRPKQVSPVSKFFVSLKEHSNSQIPMMANDNAILLNKDQIGVELTQTI